MPEVYVQMKLNLPDDRADEIEELLSATNGEVDGADMFEHYGKLGPGIEERISEAAESDPNWVDDPLSPEETLAIQEIDRRDNMVLIEYLVSDTETGDNLVDFLSDIFSMADIEVDDSFVYSEDDMEDMDDGDILDLYGDDEDEDEEEYDDEDEFEEEDR
jgi:Cft2 family RNA processing exonuclease